MNEFKQIIQSEVNNNTLLYLIIVSIVPIIVSIITNIFYDHIKWKNDFVRAYRIEHLKNLYLPLYSIVAQSEFIKLIYHIDEKEIFLSIKRTDSEKLNNKISEFDHEKFVDLTIDNAQYASLKLLKMAIAYRYVIANAHSEDDDVYAEVYKYYDVIAINYMKTIVEETNEYLKYCNMKYDKKEMKI